MANTPGGYAAITQLEDGGYRFFLSSSASTTAVSYSDDYGQTWNTCTGIDSAYGSKATHMLVETDKPNVVYAYATYYNSSWSYSKSAAEFSDAHYTLYVSTDYGKTFTTSTDIAMYDQCDSAGRIAYLQEDDLILGAGWYGMYRVTGGGKNVEKLDVYYCKTVGYGAPEKEGGINTLYMYGQPTQSDPEGIYRSTDGGETWLLINQSHLYGGTGNGNFLVGDMNTFGTVYMSTVGCGIVCGKLVGDENPTPTTSTTTTTSTTKTTTTTTVSSLSETTAKNTTASVEETTLTEATKSTTTVSKTTTTTAKPTTSSGGTSSLFYGDVTMDGSVDVTDAVYLNKVVAGAVQLNDQARANADCNGDGEVGAEDAVVLMRFLVHLITSLPEVE
jgi:hypothetical protein